MKRMRWRLRPAVVGENVLQRIEDQQWLDNPSYRIGHALALAGDLLGDLRRPVANVLHGTVLGHPMHTMMTDVPVGAWTAALVLDATDAAGAGRRPGYRQAARTTVGVGLAGAGVAAAAGLADWHDTQDNARRTGMVHGTLNVVAISCYAGSWLYRRGGRHRAGRRASLVGYALVMCSGFLGGSLVSRHRVGVDHADRRLVPRRFTDALPEDQLPERQPVGVEVDGMAIVLVRSGGQIHALGQECAHLGGPLDQGWLRGDAIVCPWHGSQFDLATGRVRRGPAMCPQPRFDTRIHHGRIQVRCRPPSPDAPPGSVVTGDQDH